MRKKHLKKRHLETWPTKEREARFILRSLATKISKRKRHDTTQLDTTGTLTNTHVPGVLPGRTPGTQVNTHVPRTSQGGLQER